MSGETRGGVLTGLGLVVLYTLTITLSDAFTKHLAASFQAPQVLVIVSGAILGLSLAFQTRHMRLGRRSAAEPHPLKTTMPGAMALRALMTVVAAILFYYAFAMLPFADVFIFIALVPIFAGLLSAPILGEKVAPMSWLALGLASCGVILLFPEGRANATLGHAIAFFAAFSGTVAIVLGRLIARSEDAPMAQVFWPQAAVFASMALVAPFVWEPIGTSDLCCALGCGAALFAARYALALALQVLPAYTATSLLNLQFVWMVLVGMVVFGEMPQIQTIIGATIIVGTGLLLVWDQYARGQRSLASGGVQLARKAWFKKLRLQ